MSFGTFIADAYAKNEAKEMPILWKKYAYQMTYMGGHHLVYIVSGIITQKKSTILGLP